MIEDQIDVKMVAIQRQPLLAGDKGETLAQFPEENPEGY